METTRQGRARWLVIATVLLAAACGTPDEAPQSETADKTAATSAGEVPPEAQAPSARIVAEDEFPSLTAPWTGDLDGMIERRLVRMLVAYSGMFYFVDRGQQRGITYEGAKLLEDALNAKLGQGQKHLRTAVVLIPVPRDQLLPALEAGAGDIAAANLTITPERLRSVDFSIPVTENVSEIVVTGPGVEPPKTVADLAGREVFVRASSSYAESLRALSALLEGDGRPPIRIVPADERLESEDILEMVQAGLVGTTVVDLHIARFWAQVFPSLQVHETLAVRTGGAIGWAFRKNSPKLTAFVNEFARKNRQGTLTGNILIKRYVQDAGWAKNATSEKEMARFRSMVDLFKTYADRYALDHLLVIAQGYQESGLDQSRRSHVGAIGVMQLMPATARDKNVGIPDIQNLESNVHAGAKYLRFLIDRYFSDPAIEESDRLLLAFAAYNAGPGRVAGLRKKATNLGLDPNVWFDNVEIVAAREIGRETVQYVSNIYKYYIAYKLVTGQARERAEALKAPIG